MNIMNINAISPTNPIEKIDNKVVRPNSPEEVFEMAFKRFASKEIVEFCFSNSKIKFFLKIKMIQKQLGLSTQSLISLLNETAYICTMNGKQTLLLGGKFRFIVLTKLFNFIPHSLTDDLIHFSLLTKNTRSVYGDYKLDYKEMTDAPRYGLRNRKKALLYRLSSKISLEDPYLIRFYSDVDVTAEETIRDIEECVLARKGLLRVEPNVK